MRVRAFLAVLTTFAVATAIASSGSTAAAAESPAFLTIRSEQGDPVGFGLDYAYERPADRVWATGWLSGDPTVHVGIEGANGESWSLDFHPPAGERLAAGHYAGAERYPFQAADRPGLSVTGGFGCNQLSGSFTILRLEFDQYGYFSAFHASFEQQCEGASGKLTGEVMWTPAPQLPPLELGVLIDGSGRVGKFSDAIVTGSFTCTQSVQLTLGVRVTQKSGAGEAYGETSQQAECHPGASYPWEVRLDTSEHSPLQLRPGPLTVEATASGFDVNDGSFAYTTATESVRLLGRRPERASR